MAAGDLTLTRDAQNGRLDGTTLNQLSDAWGYTGFGEVQSYAAAAGANTLYAMSFTRDNAGRILTKTETIGGVTSVSGYTYDAARGWLTDVTRNGVPTAHYDYDDNGNRTHVLNLDREVSYAVADGQDRIGGATVTLPMQVPQPVSWTYSANGEVQSQTVNGATTQYSYDVRGSLRDVTLADSTLIKYLVDATGRRIGKLVNGALTQGWLYQDGLKPIAELDGAGNVVSRFVYAGKANVPEYLVKNGAEYRLITDQLGSVRLVVNAADGSVAQQMEYDEFGRVLSDSNPGFQPFGYAGGLYDTDTKLVRFGARDYDAETGRWLSKDPIGFSGGDNWYAYCGNEPVNCVDPLGLAGMLDNIYPDDFIGPLPLGGMTQSQHQAWVQQAEGHGASGDDGIFALVAPEIPIVSKTIGVIAAKTVGAMKGAANALGIGKVKCPPVSAKLFSLADGDASLVLMKDGQYVAHEPIGFAGRHLDLASENGALMSDGSLAPGYWIGTVGKHNGEIVALNSQTFYKNMAPNADATIALRSVFH